MLADACHNMIVAGRRVRPTFKLKKKAGRLARARVLFSLIRHTGHHTVCRLALASLCVVWRDLASQHVMAHASAGQEVPPQEKAGRGRPEVNEA